MGEYSLYRPLCGAAWALVCPYCLYGIFWYVGTVFLALSHCTVTIDRSPQRRQKWKEVCEFMSLPDKYIEYDVENWWNPTYRMLDDVLKVRVQINRFLALQTEIPPFTVDEWLRLSQIHQVLAKFNELCSYLRRDHRSCHGLGIVDNNELMFLSKLV